MSDDNRREIKKIYIETYDSILIEIANASNRAEEIESRILSAVRELLLDEEIEVDSEMYFVYELLDSLLRYEKDEDDIKKIEYAINPPLNPMHIGKIFYDKLICR